MVGGFFLRAETMHAYLDKPEVRPATTIELGEWGLGCACI